MHTAPEAVAMHGSYLAQLSVRRPLGAYGERVTQSSARSRFGCRAGRRFESQPFGTLNATVKPWRLPRSFNKATRRAFSPDCSGHSAVLLIDGA